MKNNEDNEVNQKLVKIWANNAKKGENSPKKVEGTNLYMQKRAV